jgi:hypothetical protein
MTVELHEETGERIMTVRLSGKLSTEDYEVFVPEAERLIRRHGKIRLLVELDEFRGWDMGARWEDFKFDVTHFNDIDRLAYVGPSKWDEDNSVFCRPFAIAEIRYFDRDQIRQARRWLQQGTGCPRTAGSVTHSHATGVRAVRRPDHVHQKGALRTGTSTAVHRTCTSRRG